MDMLGYFLAGMPTEELQQELAELRVYRDGAQRAHARAAGRARPAARPGRPRRGGRERRRRPAAHRRGDGAPRVRELDQRSVRALPPPRRPRLGRPPAARAGPRPQAAARVGRPPRPRAPGHHPHRRRRPQPHRARRRPRRPRRHRVLLPAARRGDGRALPRPGARSTRWSPPAARTTTGRVKPKARLGVGSLRRAGPRRACSPTCAASPRTSCSASPDAVRRYPYGAPGTRSASLRHSPYCPASPPGV